MKIGFYFAHPAHYHLFKNSIKSLSKNHEIIIVYNQKDVLDDLTKELSNTVKIKRIKTKKIGNNKSDLLIQFIQKNFGAYLFFKKFKPDIVIGTPILISLIGKILKYKSIIVNEDDFDIIRKTANLGYPYADHIISPQVCRTGKFWEKTINYNSYHELAYLHPNNFNPNKGIAEKYISTQNTYYIIRFAKLIAHHDKGVEGINTQIALKLINKLSSSGNVYITSERHLESELEAYRIRINPIDMHHVMAYASLYIGDSQTMAAESGVLGVPFIRYNDFVGRISYLEELENKYKLGYGIKPNNPEELFKKIDELISNPNLNQIYKERRDKMLSEKIDFSKFMTWFIEKYPNSVKILQENTDYQYNFK